MVRALGQISVFVIIACLANPAFGEQVKEGFRADFDDGTLGGSDEPKFYNRSDGPTKIEAERSSWGIENGVATLSGDFNANSTKGHADFVPLSWNDLNVSLIDHPMLEFRFRAHEEKSKLLVQCTYEYVDGTTWTPYFYVWPKNPGEWETYTKRIVGDCASPTELTPRRMKYLSVWLLGDRPFTVDFDWVRQRGLNQEEQRWEDDWIEHAASKEPTEPQILNEFFPFGVYDAPPASSSAHMISHRMAMRLISTHHLNFVLAGFVESVEPAEEMGMHVGVRMRGADRRFEQGGAQAVIDWAKPIVDGFRDSSAVICYDMGDERKIFELWATVGGIGVLNTLDPTRPSGLCFYDMKSIKAYSPYVPLNISDIYPLSEGSDRTAAYLYDWCRQLARDTGNKRQWMVLQAFGDAPWRPPGGEHIPTVEQLRLQVYSALAGGARGIIMYSTSFDRYRMMADQWGNPNELMQEAARLGEILIPIGRRLLDCEIDFDSKIGCDNENILVGVMHSKARDVRYVILANKDEQTPQGGGLSGVGNTLLDLESLKKVKDGRVEPLLPGGGRILMIGDEEDLRAEAKIIRANRDEEMNRAATPDRLFEARGCNAIHRDQLDETARMMGEIEPAMFPDNPDPKVVELMNPHRDGYWKLHVRWTSAYAALLAGDALTDSLIAAIVRDAESVAEEVGNSLGDHPMYPGATAD
jgi:hypothetical protein